MRIAHINASTDRSSGHIATDLCRFAQKAGHKVLLCYSRGPVPVGIPSMRVGETPDAALGFSGGRIGAPRRIFHKLQKRIHRRSAAAGVVLHTALSRITDRSGFYSRRATRRFVRQLKGFAPDLVHLNDLNGYYLHLPTLFEYLLEADIPVVWTLHDCWPFTGHCTYFQRPIPSYTSPENAPDPSAPIQCLLWQKRCSHCPLKHAYPASLLMDQSTRNHTDKKDLFTSLRRLTLTVPSRWMADQVRKSFLGRYPIRTLPGGIDLTVYAPCADERHMQDIALFYGLDRLEGRYLVLSVADVWDERTGLEDLIQLAYALGDDYCVVPVGLSQRQIASLPECMLGLPRPANAKDLCVLYTAADLCVCLSHGEAMGLSLIEAMACGTQVLCYNTTALPELLTEQVGVAVGVGDITAAAGAVRRLCYRPKDPLFCIARAAQFGVNLRYEAYLKLYEQLGAEG